MKGSCWMKKRGIFLFMIISSVFTFALAACNRQGQLDDGALTEDTGYASMISDRSTIQFGSVCARSEKAIYFTEKIDDQSTYSRIMYYEPTSGITGPLCDKPECTHENENCNAVFNWDIRAFAYYSGHLYFDLDSYLEKNPEPGRAIYCCEETGNNRRKLGHAGGEAILKSTGSFESVFHRGRFWNGGSFYKIIDGTVYSGVTIEAYDLSSPEEEQILLEKEFPGKGQWAGDVSYQLIEDKLYYMIASVDQTKEEGSSEMYHLELGCLDLENGDAETFWIGPTDYIACAFWVTDEGILVSSGKDGRVFRYDNETGELRLWADLGELGGYSHAAFSEDLVFCFKMDRTESAMCILNFSGEVLFNGSRPREDYEELRQILCSDQDYLYVKYHGFEKPSKESVVSINLRTGERKVLWTDLSD